MRKGEETVKRILDVALELFVKQGYYNTSIDAITSKAGLTKGAFYSHFKSKRALVLKLIDEFDKRIFDQLINNLNKISGNAIEKLKYVTEYLAQIEESRPLIAFQIKVTGDLKSDPDFEPILKPLFGKHQKILSDIYRQGAEEGIFRKDIVPDLAGSIFLAIASGVFQQWVSSTDGVQRQYVETIQKILIEGVVAKPLKGE